MLKDYEKIRIFDYKKDFTLENIRKILKLFANPEQSLKFIHIAGTKGKTSTAFYIAALLEQAGFGKIGLYTSPHLISPVERIKINGRSILESDLNRIFQKVEDLSNEKNIPLTYFEAMTASAFIYFKENSCDYVVLETGLGGRLDATNAVLPLISIITTLGKDHTAILGNNLFKIAREKLGILKPKVPYLLGRQNLFLYLFCRWVGFLKKAIFISSSHFRISMKDHCYLIKRKKHEIIFHGPLYGTENLALAYSCALHLKAVLPRRLEFYHQVPGRFEVYPNGKGAILLDGAHNPVAARKLKQSITAVYKKQKWVFIFNTFPDKDFKGMIHEFKNIADEFIIIDKPEYAGAQIIQELRHNHIPCKLLKPEEFELKSDLFYCVTGSFYLTGYFKNRFGFKS